MTKALTDLTTWSCVECGRDSKEARRSRNLAYCSACDRLRWRDTKKPSQLLNRLVHTLTSEDFILAAAERIRTSRPTPLPRPYREQVLKAVGALVMGEVGTREEAAARFGLNAACSVPTGRFRYCGCAAHGYHKRRCRHWKPVKTRRLPCGCVWRKHRAACPFYGPVGGAT